MHFKGQSLQSRAFFFPNKLATHPPRCSQSALFLPGASTQDPAVRKLTTMRGQGRVNRGAEGGTGPSGGGLESGQG